MVTSILASQTDRNHQSGCFEVMTSKWIFLLKSENNVHEYDICHIDTVQKVRVQVFYLHAI